MKPFSYSCVFIIGIGGGGLLGFGKKRKVDFDAIFEQYNSYVFKIVINESNNKLTKEDIEETVSDIFFLLWKNIKKIEDQDKMKSYLGTIARNTTRNRLRTVKQDLSLEENIFLRTPTDSSSDFVNEQLRIVHDELQNIGEEDREIFLMYYYDNKKIKEIALIQDMNASTVKTKLHRIKKKLKKSLKKGGY